MTNSIPEREGESRYDGQNEEDQKLKSPAFYLSELDLGQSYKLHAKAQYAHTQNFISALMKLKQLSVELSALLYTQHNCGVTTVKPQ